jgi:hypothetical protein
MLVCLDQDIRGLGIDVSLLYQQGFQRAHAQVHLRQRTTFVVVSIGVPMPWSAPLRIAD